MEKNIATDCVLFSVPPMLLLGPHLAPALLKAFAKREGYNIICFDPSPEIYDGLNDIEQEKWPYNDFNNIYPSTNSLNLAADLWVDSVLKMKPKLIGLSTHALASTYFIKAICNSIRKKAPSTPIAIGGPVVLEIGESLKNEGYVDYYVVGDGEEAFLSLLSGKCDHPNINGKIPVPMSNEAFQNLPEPDFSDFDIEYYKKLKPKGNRIYLIGSRGCVFNCSFCNVPAMTQKYRYKDGEAFADEIISVQKKFDTSYIELADSITNASHIEFQKLCKALIKKRTETGIKPNIVCFFRAKQKRFTREEDFRLAAEAGICRFKIGIESGSFDVRKHIGKNETNDDIFYTLEMCLKYKIKVNLLLIVGYINETNKMFNETMNFLSEIRKRNLDRIIEMVVVNELYISNDTPIKDYAIEKDIITESDYVASNLHENWEATLDNGEVLNRSIRLQRIDTVKAYIYKNFRFSRNFLVFSSEEKSSTFLNKNEAL